MPCRFHASRSALALLTLLAALGSARAESTPKAPPNARHQQECGACHVAFAPGMLPAASWQRLMSDLPRHFGTDASLDAAAASEIGTWLTTNAGTTWRMQEAPAEDRITRSAGFVRKHHEVPADTWKRLAVRSAANCAACHPRADQGDFDEHNVRIPS
jgi:hypothetical protein